MISTTGMREAIDHYVIQGISHNTPFIADVCRNVNFQVGDTSTDFIQTHYPDGFGGIALSSLEKVTMAAAVAAIEEERRSVLGRPPLPGGHGDMGPGAVVLLDGLFGSAFAVRRSAASPPVLTVAPLHRDGTAAGDPVKLSLDALSCPPAATVARVRLSGRTYAVQVLQEATDGTLRIQMYGAEREVMVMGGREHELSRYMKEPPVVDRRHEARSPMPGKLVEYAVEVGQEVEVGQKLCIVEAMKMQNMIRSERTGTIAKLCVAPNASVKADEVLIEFA